MVNHTFFPHLCTDHVTYEHDKPHFLFEGVTQEPGTICICAARLTETLNSQLEAELSTFVQRNAAHAALQSALGVPGLHLLW